MIHREAWYREASNGVPEQFKRSDPERYAYLQLRLGKTLSDSLHHLWTNILDRLRPWGIGTDPEYPWSSLLGRIPRSLLGFDALSFFSQLMWFYRRLNGTMSREDYLRSPYEGLPDSDAWDPETEAEWDEEVRDTIETQVENYRYLMRKWDKIEQAIAPLRGLDPTHVWEDLMVPLILEQEDTYQGDDYDEHLWSSLMGEIQ